jgi:hypothetical protein
MVYPTAGVTGGMTPGVSKWLVATFEASALGSEYALSHIYYGTLVKVIPGGIFFDIDRSVGRLILPPVYAIGQFPAGLIRALLSGWRRFSRRQKIYGYFAAALAVRQEVSVC